MERSIVTRQIKDYANFQLSVFHIKKATGTFYSTGGHFSKAPETFRARKAIAKSRTLRFQSCFIRIL